MEFYKEILNEMVISYNSLVNLSFFLTEFTLDAQWLSGRVLDSRPRGRGFKPHQRHCVVLEQDTFILA